MKAVAIVFLFALSLCDIIKPHLPNDGRPIKRIPPINPKLITKEFCDKCVKKGFCPVACAEILKKENEEKKSKYAAFCEECEKNGSCPLICKQYFIKKYEKQCEECEKKGYCPLECKKYFVKKMNKKKLSI